MDDETLFSRCPVVSGWVISFSVFYRDLFLFFYTVLAERNCLLLYSCLDKFYTVLQVWLFRFVRVVSYLWCFFQFWALGLSSRICDRFIRHSLWTTVTSAGFSSRPRPVFPVG